MPAAERRNRGDLTAAAVLTVVVLVVTTALWWASDARRTTLITATGPAPEAPAERQLPTALVEIWRAPSPATPVPVVHGATVATGAAGEVAGRELRSGSVRWSYRRDLPLCTVASALTQVAALYQQGQTCSEVTILHWADGRRGPQRNGPVEAPTRLAAEGDQAATTGQRYLEVWRSDLVRTLSYGRLPTPAQSDRQPRPECLHASMALESAGEGGGRLAVIERCPPDGSTRLTVQRTRPKEADQPEVDFSTPLPGNQAQLIAVSPQRVAVAVPGPARLLVFDAKGNQVAEHPLAVPDADLIGDPPGGLAMVTQTPTALYWFTGSTTIALDAGELRPRWSRPGSLGPGSVIDGRLLMPTRGALSVLAIITGRELARLPVGRADYHGPVMTATSGGVVLEQRGDTLVALG